MKALLSYCIPEVYYRPFYSLASALLIQLLIFCWHPMPTVIWDFQHPILWYLIMGKKYTNLCNSYIYLAVPRNKTWRHLKEINVCNCPRISCYASSHILAEKTGRWIQSERSCMHVIWTPIASTEFSKFWSVSGLNTLCWFGVVVSLFALNPLELVGVQEPLTRLLGWWVTGTHLYKRSKPSLWWLVSQGLYWAR